MSRSISAAAALALLLAACSGAPDRPAPAADYGTSIESTPQQHPAQPICAKGDTQECTFYWHDAADSPHCTKQTQYCTQGGFAWSECGTSQEDAEAEW